MSSFQGMTHQEAIGLFKEVKKGPVVVTIGRRTSTSSSSLAIAVKSGAGNLFAEAAEQ
jgi:hypothetical protein